MAAERDADLRQVGDYVQHATVVMAQQPQTVVRKHAPNLGSRKPVFHAQPCPVFFEESSYLMERNVGAFKDVRNLRHRAGRAVGQPVSCHRSAIGKRLTAA